MYEAMPVFLLTSQVTVRKVKNKPNLNHKKNQSLAIGFLRFKNLLFILISSMSARFIKCHHQNIASHGACCRS